MTTPFNQPHTDDIPYKEMETYLQSRIDRLATMPYPHGPYGRVVFNSRTKEILTLSSILKEITDPE